MPQKRRQFLRSAAQAAFTFPLCGALSNADSPNNLLLASGRSASAIAQGKGTAKTQGSKNRLDIALFSDVEDIFNPPEFGNDDSIKEIATILTQEGLRANFMVIGERALVLRERGRK